MYGRPSGVRWCFTLLDQSELWRDEADYSGGDQNIQTTVNSEQTTQNTVTSG